MNVMDALSTLNPEKFGSSQIAPTAKAELRAGRSKRLPTPGDINSTTTPAYLLLASRTYRSAVPAASGANAGTPPDSPSTQPSASSTSKQKKSAPPSKHLADIGARAEEKHQKMMARKKEKLGAALAGRNRLDDMDAFFISDDDDDDNDGNKAGKKPNAAAATAAKPSNGRWRILSCMRFMSCQLGEACCGFLSNHFQSVRKTFEFSLQIAGQ